MRIPFRYFLPLIGLVQFFVAWVCLFTKRRTLSLGLVVWLVINCVVYRIGLWTLGWPHPWVFVGDLTEAFNLSPALADGILFSIALLVLAGGILLLHRVKSPTATSPQTLVYFKVHCPACGGKTAFDVQWFGKEIPCPHCNTNITLK